MATAHMHPHQSWQMQPGTVHSMNHYHQQEHELPHHQAWTHTPSTTMASYGTTPITMPSFSVVHPQQPMHYGQHASQQQHHHHHHHHQQQPPQHQHHHQQAQLPVRPQSSASSMHSALPSALPSPVHPMSHSQVVSPLNQTHSPISLPTLGHNVLPMPIASPQQQGRYHNQPVPHQVVGQQGIRGILPKSMNDQIPTEEAFEPEQAPDGSWPCRFCGKSYRHSKHLRRHHSRHTGDTPYECILCCRRFGRSDVLKRHYQKCATRRGVEPGDHLEGQRGHPRRRKKNDGSNTPSVPSPTLSNGHPEVKPPATNGSLPMDGVPGSWT